MSDKSLEEILLLFFLHIAQKDKTQLKTLKQQTCFSVEPTRWCFTLPALFHFLQQQDSIFNEIDYNQFRQLLFNSTINQTIKAHGAEIIIIDNLAKVDESHYALIWQAS